MGQLLLLALALCLVIAMALLAAHTKSLAVQIVVALLTLWIGALYRDFAWQERSLVSLERDAHNRYIGPYFSASGIPGIMDNFKSETTPERLHSALRSPTGALLTERPTIDNTYRRVAGAFRRDNLASDE
jgi:hypothetical protein